MKEKTLSRILIISLGTILIIGLFVVYKLHLFVEYNYEVDLNYLNNLGEITVKTDSSISNTTVYDMNLYLKEDLEKTILSDDSGYLYKKDDKIELWISAWTSDIVKDWIEHSDKKEINFEKLSEKENIKTQYDMFTYLIKHKDDKLSPFSRINTMYMFYWSRTADAEISTKSVEKAGLIKGNLTGYYTLGNSFNTVKIFHNDKIYILRFNKMLYTETDIESILNSITFNF